MPYGLLTAERVSCVALIVPRLSTVALAGFGALMIVIVMTPTIAKCGGDKQALMKIHVDKIAGEWHARWMLRTGGECPGDLVEVARATGAQAEDIEDIWGARLQCFCMPGGRLGVYSFGEDGLAGTGDDIRSWEPRRRR